MKFLNIVKKVIPRSIFKKMQPKYHYLMSFLAAVAYRHPSEELVVIGVTGTTGKTTCVYLIAKMLEEAGCKTGFTSTAMFNDGEKEWLNDKKMTMVGRFFSQNILRSMVKNGCKFAIVETTSEGIVQYRHKFINYDIVVMTGLYPEHIESHGSFENYKEAKGRLFAHLRNCKTKYVGGDYQVMEADNGIKKLDFKKIKKTIIANADDEHSDYFMSFAADEKFAFFVKANEKNKEGVENIQYGDIEVSGNGTKFVTQGTDINLQLLGDFNVGNAMTAVCVGLSQGMDIKVIKKSLETIKGVAGRLEKIDEGQDFNVIIDYAFEPKAAESLYRTAKLIPHNRIIHVLGSAGGGRDVARRPILGKLAGENADIVIVTNEDPYDDDPSIIIDQVVIGAEKAGKVMDENLFKFLGRRDAIEKAIKLAKKDDLVLVTGKGNEQAICVANGAMIKWDDRVEARKALKKFKN